MTRRDFVTTTGFGAAAATSALRAAPAPARPNVILIISDDQGYGDLSLHGNPYLRTPHIDSIGSDGVRFDQFHVNPVCSPTRSSLLTGRYYYRTGVVDTYLGRSMMHPDEVTLPEVLRGAGYRTGIFGKWHLGDHVPLRAVDQGFEEALTHDGGGIAQPSDPPGGSSYFDPVLKRTAPGAAAPVEFKAKGYCTDLFFDGAIDYIRRNRNRPFFAYIAANAPHDPLQIADSYVQPFTSQGLDSNTAKTYGMVKNLDDNVGRLLKSLEQWKLTRNTLLIFMTDNGPQRDRYNAGMRGRKGTVYQGGIRVPFFVRWPGGAAPAVKPGRVDERVLAHIDVMPTIAEACGAKLPPNRHLDGRSFLSAVRNPGSADSDPERTLFFQWHRGERGRLYENCAARNNRWKLVNGKELYDLSADSAESTDVSAQHPDVTAGLRAQYETWFREMEAERNFEPPRIWIGDTREPAVLLTRQDWRGERAGWEATSEGHWLVEVRQAGRYRLEAIFDPLPEASAIVFGETRIEAAAGQTSAAADVMLDAGNAQLTASIHAAGGSRGVRYLRVSAAPRT